MTITEQYKYFLKSWLEWATTGAPNNQPYARSIGLCNNIYNLEDLDDESEVFALLMDALREKDLCTAFPFGRTQYLAARENETQHLVLGRLDFVRAELERLA